MQSNRLQSQFDRLWKALVPKSGQANTVQGELVRNIGNMQDELYVNGYANWDDGYEIYCKFLQTNLCDGTFSSDVNAGIERDIDLIRAHGRGKNVSGNNIDKLHDDVQALVVEWCEKHPKAITHIVNSRLLR